MTRWNQAVLLEAFRTELVRWGLLERVPGSPGWQQTPLGQQADRFRASPQEEPSFPAAWLAAFERRAPRFDNPVSWNGRAGRDPAIEIARVFLAEEATTLSRLAQAGDVRGFHSAWVALMGSEEDTAP